MSNLEEHLHTDWASLTPSDWVGIITTVVVFFLMIALYAYVLHPTNKARLESKRHIPIDDDRIDTEENK